VPRRGPAGDSAPALRQRQRKHGLNQQSDAAEQDGLRDGPAEDGDEQDDHGRPHEGVRKEASQEALPEAQPGDPAADVRPRSVAELPVLGTAKQAGQVGALDREEAALQLQASAFLKCPTLSAAVEGDQRDEAVVACEPRVPDDDVEEEAMCAVVVLHPGLPLLAWEEVCEEAVEVTCQRLDVAFSALGHVPIVPGRPTLRAVSDRLCVMRQPTALTVVGNRPQYIKCAVVSRCLREVLHEVLLDTGQHYDHGLAGIFFEELDLPEPDICLGVGSGSHAEQTALMLTGIEAALRETAPELVLVYGDTNSTLAGALAAAKLDLPVAHVEAGLRSYDRGMPEEINRVLTDRVSELLFCPTESAVENLRREGMTAGVSMVGDVMFDLAQRALDEGREAAVLERFGLTRGAYVCATCHRPANADDPQRLGAIVAALSARDEPVIFPIHPRTRLSLERFGLAGGLGGNVTLVEPVGYLESQALIRNARVLATDSGGMQKEAYFFGVPCVTMRDNSEWVETLRSGWNVLVGADRHALAAALDDPPRGGERQPFYGSGDAGERIAATVAGFLEGRIS
jgi:UDP-GlcNAc3NAcA epimerase